MGLFKTREEKRIEQRMLVKRTISSMEKQIDKLEERKKAFVEQARKARAEGLDAQYTLALSGYRTCLVQSKRLSEMKLNFELLAQMKDMAELNKDFLKGMSALSGQMSRLVSEREFLKVQKSFALSMQKAGRQSELMGKLLSGTEAAFEESAGMTEEEKAKIEGELAMEQEDGVTEEDIEREIAELKRKLESE
ncbi:MAG: hypothetical protein ACI4U2_04740 [Christensenellaceae bacterium]